MIYDPCPKLVVSCKKVSFSLVNQFHCKTKKKHFSGERGINRRGRGASFLNQFIAINEFNKHILHTYTYIILNIYKEAYAKMHSFTLISFLERDA